MQQVTLQRDEWNSRMEFFLAAVGYTANLDNVWRFPKTVYMNGGGVFFIPYFVLLIFGGLPLVYMELALGQYHGLGVFTVWKHICPLIKGVGWATVLINFMVAIHHNTIISWAIYYFIMSFKGLRTELPWKSCYHSWNTNCCIAADVKEYQYLSNLINTTENSTNTHVISSLNSRNCTRLVYSTEEYFYRRIQEVDKADAFNNIGKIKWELILCLLGTFILIYFSLWKGIKSLGKAVWITTIVPHVILIILLIHGITLSGASIGIQYYLHVNLNLLENASIWNAAAIEIFFTLGPGFGAHLALSSYNTFYDNCYRDALLISSISCATSVLFGFVIFSALGHIAYISRTAFEILIENKGSELIFIVYPYMLGLMNWSTLWSILFFFMLITLGIGTIFGNLESIITSLCDEFPNIFGRNRPFFVLGVLIICFLGALPTCTYGGDYIVTLIKETAVIPTILFVVLIECIAILWFYGTNRFAHDIKEMIGTRPSAFWRIIWYILSPMFLFSIFCILMNVFLFGNIQIKHSNLRSLPISVQIWSYLMVFMPILCIPVYAIYKVLITPGRDFNERLQRAFKPEESLTEFLHSRSAGDY